MAYLTRSNIKDILQFSTVFFKGGIAMRRSTHKLFKNSEKKIEVKKFDTRHSYYSFVKEMKKQGLSQFLLTSDLMISLIVDLIVSRGMHFSSIVLYDDEDELAKNVIEELFRDVENNKISEKKLHTHLSYLEDAFSVDIMEVKIYNKTLGELTIKSNGVIELFDDAWITLVVKSLTELWGSK